MLENQVASANDRAQMAADELTAERDALASERQSSRNVRDELRGAQAELHEESVRRTALERTVASTADELAVAREGLSEVRGEREQLRSAQQELQRQLTEAVAEAVLPHDSACRFFSESSAALELYAAARGGDAGRR